MEKKFLDFIQQNSPDGGFLQSEYWSKFQESWGRKTFELKAENENGDIIICAYMIVHTLPVVRKYFYMPRGPIIQVQSSKFKVQSDNSKLKVFFDNLIELAKKNHIGWIRVELNSDSDLEIIRNTVEINGNKLKIVKAPVDMQPKEILVMDISGSEEEILARMKQKTRYNIRLAEKKGVKVFSVNSDQRSVINRFLELVKITAKRDRITSHPEGYYRKMFKTIPPEILKLYVVEYDGKIIAANIVSFFGNTATYMHGASDYAYRDVMAPYLLQWQAILDAKKSGLTQYDFGGVDTRYEIRDTKYKKWEGLTKFKAGFAPDVESIKFSGCYDIILKPGRYNLYRILQAVKRIF